METVRYPSKRDLWVTIVIWIALAMMLASLATTLFCPPSVTTIAVVLLTLGCAILSLSVLYGTVYTFTDGMLSVRCGPFRWNIDVSTIRSATPSDDPGSAPACSLDRIAIVYGDETILVSPVDRDVFLAELARRNPALVREGDVLARPS